MKILVTGCAGFIGYHLTLRLLSSTNHKIFGIDNLNNYYDIKLKKQRLKILKKDSKFKFYKIDLINKRKLKSNFTINKYNIIIHLAAQAGVRFSIKNPQNYFDNNISAFFNIIDLSKLIKVKHFIFASTSSVYGDTKTFPVKEEASTDKPLSFYAATKKCNEIIAYSYSNIFKLKCTGLRFFTVYGPFGRPDMALFKFTKSILENKYLELFNFGKHIRDFTYIDDVVNYIIKLMHIYPKKEVPFQIFNIGSNNPQKLKTFLKFIEKSVYKKAKISYKKLQSGDIYKTHSDNSSIIKKTKIYPKMELKLGIEKFVKWYKNFYNRK